jgi:hypothetical protein
VTNQKALTPNHSLSAYVTDVSVDRLRHSCNERAVSTSTKRDSGVLFKILFLLLAVFLANNGRGFHRGKSLFPLGLSVLAFGKFSLLSWRCRLWVRFACESYPGIVEFYICIYFILIYFLFIHELHMYYLCPV